MGIYQKYEPKPSETEQLYLEMVKPRCSIRYQESLEEMLEVKT